MTHLENLSNPQTLSNPSIFSRARRVISPRRILQIGTISATLFPPLGLTHASSPFEIPDFYGPPAYIANRKGESKYDTEPGADIVCFPQDTKEIASLESLEFQKDDFVDISTNQSMQDEPLFNPDGTPIYPKNTRMLLLQVDTDESDTCRIDTYARIIGKAFEQIPLTISYVKHPVPIPFTRANEHVARGLEETEAVMHALHTSTGRNYEKVLVLLNTNIFFGITDYRTKYDIAFTSLGNPESLYAILHESGHLLGLDDGYRHNLTFQAALTSSELTFGHQYSEKEARAAFDTNKPDTLLPTGIVINHKQVFAREAPGFEGFNLMRSSNSQRITARLKAGQPILSPYQVRYIREHVKRER